MAGGFAKEILAKPDKNPCMECVWKAYGIRMAKFAKGLRLG